MKISDKRTVLLPTSVLLIGLLGGGFAWSQGWDRPERPGRAGGPGGERVHMGGERVHMLRGEHGEEYGGYRGPYHRRGRGRGFMGRMVKELGLNNEQTKAVKDVLIEALKKNIKLRADARVARIELGQLITKDQPDKAAVQAKVDQIASIQGDIMRERVDTALAVREILTPAQREKADRVLERFLDGHRRYRG
jgi:Spy/CpxP family protein refolding chaperone